VLAEYRCPLRALDAFINRLARLDAFIASGTRKILQPRSFCFAE